jgi:hypothetical protein
MDQHESQLKCLNPKRKFIASDESAADASRWGEPSWDRFSGHLGAKMIARSRPCVATMRTLRHLSSV